LTPKEEVLFMDANAFYVELRQFTGVCDRFHPHWTNGFVYTEGVKHLAERARCYWLINTIALLQARALRDAWLREFQLWELHVKAGRGTLICSRDSENEAFRLEFKLTNFPLHYVRLYVRSTVLLLPNERLKPE
jgi:hypothetical protein